MEVVFLNSEIVFFVIVDSVLVAVFLPIPKVKVCWLSYQWIELTFCDLPLPCHVGYTSIVYQDDTSTTVSFHFIDKDAAHDYLKEWIAVKYLRAWWKGQ